jgi:hypothetical protein
MTAERADRASVAANCTGLRGVAEQARQPFGPAPLRRRADALALVAGAAGSYEVGRGGRTPARSRSDVVDLGRLLAAVPAGPVIAVQNGASQQRMDTPLGRILCSRIPVQEWIRRIGNHSLGRRPPRSALQTENPSEDKGFGSSPNPHLLLRSSKSSATAASSAKVIPRPIAIRRAVAQRGLPLPFSNRET